jgi:hypothetical protein
MNLALVHRQIDTLEDLDGASTGSQAFDLEEGRGLAHVTMVFPLRP